MTRGKLIFLPLMEMVNMIQLPGSSESQGGEREYGQRTQTIHYCREEIRVSRLLSDPAPIQHLGGTETVASSGYGQCWGELGCWHQ